MNDNNVASNTTATTFKLVAVVVGMFGFGFALVPLYDLICDVTGLNGKTGDQYTVTSEQVIDENRIVKVQFLANNNAGMPWEFRPVVRTMEVTPGELNLTSFYVHNPSSTAITAQAIPSVTPFRAARYMHKTECFCFEQQELQAGESLDMPLRFIIDASLPENVTTLTLSYTIFDISDQLAAN
ncbi:MAG: cytochrome c oxidase assembly protein subunit 11 [Candidatus Azotimanducaceae bacterium]|jgi:cytochrome c oxidase assembly protein subunit 11